MYLLDTNICIYAIKKHPASVLTKINDKYKNGIKISTLTIAELEYGVENSAYPEKNKISLIKFLSIFEYLDFCEKDAIEYGKIRKFLRENGQIIGPIDMLLSAQCVANNLIMVTNNVKEFCRIPNIEIENWAE